MYGEEYTLVTVADYVLKHTPGNTVSNLSSTRALRDVTRKYGMEYNARTFPVKQQSPLFHGGFVAFRGANGDFLVYFPKRYRFV